MKKDLHQVEQFYMWLSSFTNECLIFRFSFYQWDAVQEDYTVVNSQLTFSSGSQLGDVTCGSIFIINDNTSEINKDVFLNLTSLSLAVAEIDPSVSRQTVFIQDDDGIILPIHMLDNIASCCVPI